MRILIMAAAAAALTVGPALAQQTQDASARTILERFAADYATDPYLDRETMVGVFVDGTTWFTITARPGENGAPGQVSVTDG
ncbi:MAG: hypothetical protein AB7G40_18405, partial [Hyphomonadaceae bacterium]